MLEDGFEQFPQVQNGQSRVAVDVGPSHGHVRLDFEELTLDDKVDNDNVRMYSDAAMDHELMVITNGDLPLNEPLISIPSSTLYMMLVSDGADRHTSLRVTVSCICEDLGRFVDVDGDGCSAYAPGGTKHGRCFDLASSLSADSPALSACPLACGTCDPDPCDGAPCQNGGTCTDMRSDGATCTASDLPARSAAVNAACCDEGAEDCVPAPCSAACAAVLTPFFQDCRGALKGDLLATVQQAVQQCDSVPTYQCSCVEGWGGHNCELDPCTGNPCGAHGTCYVDHPTNFNDLHGVHDYTQNFYCVCDSCNTVPFGQCQDGCANGAGARSGEPSRNECGSCDGSDVYAGMNRGCKALACQ